MLFVKKASKRKLVENEHVNLYMELFVSALVFLFYKLMQ